MVVGATARLYVMVVLTGSFMLVELIFGYISGSLALVSDSFHMLSDVLSIIVGIYCRTKAKADPTTSMTYGWKRAETLGALVNGILLLAMCLNISIEAVHRFITPEEVEEPELVLVVGGIGLGINLLGMGMFAGLGTGHGGQEEGGGHGHSHGDMNIKGVFLHVLGDALGSVAVMISALVIWLGTFEERFYIDPVASLVITVIILSSVIPLIRRSLGVLLQAVPAHLDLEQVRNEIASLDGVEDVHEFHVWQLTENKLVASVHFRCTQRKKFMKVSAKIKKVLHKHSIHATTIQPEFTGKERESICLLPCKVECEPQNCCERRSSAMNVNADSEVEEIY